MRTSLPAIRTGGAPVTGGGAPTACGNPIGVHPGIFPPWLQVVGAPRPPGARAALRQSRGRSSRVVRSSFPRCHDGSGERLVRAGRENAAFPLPRLLLRPEEAGGSPVLQRPRLPGRPRGPAPRGG